MIPNDKALEYLNSKKKIKLTTKSFSGFTKPYKNLGLIVSSLYPTKDVHRYHFNWQKVFVDSFADLIKKNVEFNPWESDEGKRLAEILFGSIRAPYIIDIWELLNSLPYQKNYDRRSFRCKPDIDFITHKISTLQDLCASGEGAGFSSLSFKEQIQYDVYSQYVSHCYLFAVVLDKGKEDLDELFDDIINAEDDIGGISRQIIKGLLLTNNPKNWELVGKLLLAAQRQEGLRQTILECLDETHLGALKYLINLVLENDLTRFSSVVRAVDTWFGFAWDAPKKSTIKKTLNFANAFLENPQEIVAALNSKDFLEVYVALWAQGVTDVDVANQSAIQLLQNREDKDSKLLALFFMAETKRTSDDLANYFTVEVGKDIELDYWMMLNLPKYEMAESTFQSIKQSVETLPAKGKKYESRVFSWKNYTIEPSFFYRKLIEKSNDLQLEIFGQDISLLPSDVRESYIRKLFPDHYTYSWHLSKKDTKKIPIKSSTLGWKRDVAYQAIKDRNESVMATGIKLFDSMTLGNDEIALLQSLLERKNKNLRKSCIRILLDQPEAVLQQSTIALIASKKIDQRLAGLEILTILDEDVNYEAFIEKHIAEYAERASLNKNEQVFLDKINKTKNENGFANGFGVIDYNNLSPLIIPQQTLSKKKSLLKSFFNKSDNLISRYANGDKTVKEINKLIDLLLEHKDYEYQYEGYRGETVTTLLSNTLTFTKKLDKSPINSAQLMAKEKLNVLPLVDVWTKWFKQSKLNDFELSTVISYLGDMQNPYGRNKGLVNFYKNYIPDLGKINLSKEYRDYKFKNNLSVVLVALLEAFGDLDELAKIKLDMLEDAIASFPDDKKGKNLDDNTWRQSDSFWCDQIIYVPVFYHYTHSNSLPQIKHIRELKTYLMAQSLGHPNHITDLKDVLTTKPKKKRLPVTSEGDSFILYDKSEVTKDDVLLEALLSNQRSFTLDCDQERHKKRIGKLNPPFDIFKPLKENLLQIEMERGELETEATEYISRLEYVEGMDYLLTVLERLGKANFERGYSYDSSSKSSTFSNIIKMCEPSSSDTFEAFSAKLDEAKLTKKRLIEVACYATQWTKWIAQYLKLDELESAVWWFHAHSSEYMNAKKETIIARYSSVPIHEFEKGGLDVDWFNKVYQSLGKANWKMLHEASKYISNGMAHRQVKLYSGVLLGETKITATMKKIKEKRDKDYVRALGLIPLSKTNPETDVLKRYNLLQVFLKESKQFGAQRQESEKNAVEIGIENLSRNAGYRDSIRFSWAMESKAAQEIMEKNTVSLDEVTVQLSVNEDGKALLSVEKNGKSQKTIPKKYQKHKDIVLLKESKNYLSKQYSRTRLSLEKAMINEDLFTLKELENILLHPVVKPMLNKLVLIDSEQKFSGFWDNGKLIDAENNAHILAAEQELLIAHPSHLFKSKQWSHYQRFLFEQKIVQPFKQVFRELYLVTDDEKENSNRSQRYEGHQIQPKKTVALLRGRGWTVNYEEGLQKVYHKEGFVASIYAMADWFSPADTEAPTLEYVAFTALRKYEYLPLAEINPIIFSEVMRDVDLVVSVAHVGGVDPEASHSSMQMRAVLAKESARLFKLDNIEIKERHILVKGKLGDYNIHLGSGNIQKDGLSLSIIPVHSQHRGRMFLPFVDDDPKSAEIISKMKLLAEDDKIQDPTVLAQINKH